ncbi:DUF1826 domain-containing protein [Roseovarius amoyensis]|uniref:DUF1826 domain-containing protein n=1 Tax=Roseovarius amoyensis TaxID=2211448 RepID=UPI000DBE0635|nr:DUF1826 domain-containing protein [Roseovarius amoyensis]
MTIVQATKHVAENGLHSVATPDGLSAIRRADCAGAIWERQPLPRLRRWIDNLAPDQLPRARVVLPEDRVCDALMDITNACGTPKGLERDLLISDVSTLAAIFANVMRVSYLRLRLDVVCSNACRKFHIDAVTARLVCTYRGTGTQYGFAGKGREPDHIFTVPTGSPIVLRGTRWPETPVSGLLHRSPPIEGTGETRLVLVLDPVTDPDEETDRHFLH